METRHRIDCRDTSRYCIGDSAQSWRDALKRLEGAYADQTLRSYRSDFGIFEAWCQRTGAPALPSSPEVVADFIAADAIKSASSTLKRRVCAIRKVHRLMRLPNPVDDEDVAIALRRAFRSKRRRPNQALGLTAPMRDQLIAACPDTLTGVRDRAMIAVGYDTLCRRSELVNLLVEDVTRLPADSDDAAMSFRDHAAMYSGLIPPPRGALFDSVDLG